MGRIMSYKRKTTLKLTVIIIITIVLGLGIYIIINSGTTPLIIPSVAELSHEIGEFEHEIDIINTTLGSHGDKWFKLDRVTYLVSPRPLPSYGEEHFPLGSKGGTTEEYYRSLIEDKDNPYNMASGKLSRIVHKPNNDVCYYDWDNDKRISVNDSIMISFSLIPQNITNESYLLNLFYIGDVEGKYSKELFEFVGTIRIE